MLKVEKLLYSKKFRGVQFLLFSQLIPYVRTIETCEISTSMFVYSGMIVYICKICEMSEGCLSAKIEPLKISRYTSHIT